MRPDEGDLDEEIRGHLAINIKERIERGEDPACARRAALMEFDAARFSVRALEATVDASVLWPGAGLALVAAVLLAYILRLPTSGLGLSGGSVRITPGTNRRLRIFATTQIACTFVLLAGAGMLVATLTALQTANTGYDLRHVLAIDLPAVLAPGLPDPSRESVSARDASSPRM